MFEWFKMRQKRNSILQRIDLSAPLLPGLTIHLADDATQIIESARLLHNSYVRRKIIAGPPGNMRLSLYTILPSTALVVARTGSTVVGTLQVHQRTETNLPIEETFDLSSIENGRLVEIGSLALHDSRALKIEEVLLPLIGYVFQLCTRSIRADRLVIAVQPATVGFYQSLFGFKVVGDGKPKKHRYAAGADAVAMWLDLHSLPKFMRSTYRKLEASVNLEDFLTVNSEVFQLFKLPTLSAPGIHPKPAIILEEIYVNRTPLLTQAPFEWRKNFASLYPDTDEYRWLFKIDADVSNRTARRYKVDEKILITDSFNLVRKGVLNDVSSGGMRIKLTERNVPPSLNEQVMVEIARLQDAPIIVKTEVKRCDLSDYTLGLRVIDPSPRYLEFVEEIRGTALGTVTGTAKGNTITPSPKTKNATPATPSTGSFMGRDIAAASNAPPPFPPLSTGSDSDEPKS